MAKYIERLEGHPNFLSEQPSERGSIPFVLEESLSDPRKERIAWWRDAPEEIIKYRANVVRDNDGNFLYRYPRGSRLIIGDKEKGEDVEVMDTCETPWANATVDRAFEELRRKDHPISVLERGFGMGITATRVIDHLVIYGGTYTVIELNKLDAAYARDEWKKGQERGIGTRTRGTRGTPSNGHKIDIEIIEGEAYEETAKLAEKGRKFDIIISDTYPLTKDAQGVNDLEDLETLKRCLETDGVFTFFAYFPGTTSPLELVRKQGDLIHKHFGVNYRVSPVRVNPPPYYKYLQTDTGPVMILPVVTCWGPRLYN